jgi:hypothetical protein
MQAIILGKGKQGKNVSFGANETVTSEGTKE